MANVIEFDAVRNQRLQNSLMHNQSTGATGLDFNSARSISWFVEQLEIILQNYPSNDTNLNLQNVTEYLAMIEDFRCELEQLEDMATFLKNLAIEDQLVPARQPK